MIKVGIIGATGYAGAELVRLLVNHENISEIHLNSKTYENIPYSQVYGSFKKIIDYPCGNLLLAELAEGADVLFIALPHGLAAQMINKEILSKTKIIDLGADYRLDSVEVYESWYGVKHDSAALINSAIYGLCEINRNEIKNYNLIANPGCYTTCSILSLAPALKNNFVSSENIIVDAKSGVSGAGRSLSTTSLYCESNENFKAYKVASHRHTPEIEQELSKISGKNINITFTPHLVPMQRGILITSYSRLNEGVSYDEVYEAYKEFYKNDTFVRILDKEAVPETRWVKNSNYCDIGIVFDERTRNLIIIGAIDNLIKGASGQAVQNMNILFGLDEKTGLNSVPTFI